MTVDAAEPRKAHLGEAPERLDAVDVRVTMDELTPPVAHPEVFLVPQVHEPVVASPPVRVDDAPDTDATPDYGLQTTLLGIGDNLGVDHAVALEDSEDNRLPTSASPALPTNAARTEVRLVNLDLPTERSFPLAVLRHAASDQVGVAVHGVPVEVDELGDLRRLDVRRKVAQKLPKLCLGNSCAD